MSQNGQREPRGRQKGGQGRSKGGQRGPKDAQRGPKNTQREPKGSQRSQKGIKVGPREAKGAPKKSKGKDIYQKTPDQPPKRTLCYKHHIANNLELVLSIYNLSLYPETNIIWGCPFKWHSLP